MDHETTPDIQEPQPGRPAGPASATEPAPGAAPRRGDGAWWAALAALAGAVLGHLPVLGAWWCRDDWGLLARAAGVVERPQGLPARWLSQHLYWQATWPLWGLDPTPHAMVRLLLHGACALLVVRLARRGGLTTAGAALAGFVFAASPLAFTPLYWASGIQELLGAALALLALERWLAASEEGRGAVVVATLAAVGALLSKESALGLPLLLAGIAWWRPGAAGSDPRRDLRLERLAAGLLLAAAGGAAVLATTLFETGAGAPYETGGLATMLPNLGLGARWLLAPGPIVGAKASWLAASVGWLLVLAWSVWGVRRWRGGQRLPLVALAGALLSITPVLPLRHHLAPYMAYLAVAGWALALGAMLPRRIALSRVALVVGLLACAGWGLVSTRTVLGRRNELGLPADDLVRATSLSWEARGALQGVAGMGGGRPVRQVTLLQIPSGPGALEYAQRYGERWAGRTEMYEALGGDLGAAMLVPSGVTAHWRNGLVTAPDSALVFIESGTGLKPWGRTGQAAYYAALTDIGFGNFDRARAHLVRAGGLNGKTILFACDQGLLPIPLAMVTQNQKSFIDWTVAHMGQDASRAEVAGLQDTFFNLVCACTGRTLEDVTKGSRVLVPAETAVGIVPGQ